MRKINDAQFFEAGDRFIAIVQIIEILLNGHMVIDGNLNSRLLIQVIKNALEDQALAVGKHVDNGDYIAAQDRSYWMFELVEQVLQSEPYIQNDPKAKELAAAASDALFKLYVRISNTK